MALTAADRLAISEVNARYCHATDAGDGPETAAQFTADGILEIAGAWQARGHAQIAEVGSFPDKPKHWVNSIVTEGNGSTASSTVYYAAIRAGGALLATGRYDSTLSKQLNGEWKLVHHRYTGDPVASTATAAPRRDDALDAEDRVAIIELIARYNNAIDRREPEAWAATFVADGEFKVGDQAAIAGREALEEFVRGRGEPDGRHWTTNTIIEGTASEASARCYLAMVRGNAIIATGRYSDALRKLDGEWRFVQRHVVIDPAPQ